MFEDIKPFNKLKISNLTHFESHNFVPPNLLQSIINQNRNLQYINYNGFPRNSSRPINFEGLSQLKSLILNWKESEEKVVELAFGSTKKTLNLIDINIQELDNWEFENFRIRRSKLSGEQAIEVDRRFTTHKNS